MEFFPSCPCAKGSPRTCLSCYFWISACNLSSFALSESTMTVAMKSFSSTQGLPTTWYMADPFLLYHASSAEGLLNLGALPTVRICTGALVLCNIGDLLCGYFGSNFAHLKEWDRPLGMRLNLPFCLHFVNAQQGHSRLRSKTISSILSYKYAVPPADRTCHLACRRAAAVESPWQSLETQALAGANFELLAALNIEQPVESPGRNAEHATSQEFTAK